MHFALKHLKEKVLYLQQDKESYNDKISHYTEKAQDANEALDKLSAEISELEVVVKEYKRLELATADMREHIHKMKKEYESITFQIDMYRYRKSETLVDLDKTTALIIEYNELITNLEGE